MRRTTFCKRDNFKLLLPPFGKSFLTVFVFWWKDSLKGRVRLSPGGMLQIVARPIDGTEFFPLVFSPQSIAFHLHFILVFAVGQLLLLLFPISPTTTRSSLDRGLSREINTTIVGRAAESCAFQLKGGQGEGSLVAGQTKTEKLEGKNTK